MKVAMKVSYGVWPDATGTGWIVKYVDLLSEPMARAFDGTVFNTQGHGQNTDRASDQREDYGSQTRHGRVASRSNERAMRSEGKENHFGK